MTSEALITAVTWLPSVSPSCLTASTVIEATRRTPFASSSTLAMASPLLVLVTRAGIWFRALRGMSGTPRSSGGSGVSLTLPRRRRRSPPGFEGGDLILKRGVRGEAVVDGDVRGGRLDAEPDPVGELPELRQLGRIAGQPAGGQPAAHGGRVGPDPDQVDRLAPQF